MTSPRRVAVVINPISGTGGGLDVSRRRAELARARIADRGIDVDVYLTERQGHAHILADAALTRGCDTVIAWGGDGTVNEVGASLAFREATLGIVPAGSGNGLARELNIPFDPALAIDVAVSGVERRIDAGEMAGRLFFNVAGIGLDARVAHRFAQKNGRRGLVSYATATLWELFTGQPDDYRVTTDGRSLEARALLIAIANTRQYGNGAKIAPTARIDDGRLDVVVIGARSPARTLLAMPHLFTGGIAQVSGVSVCASAGVDVVASQPMLFHVDGEPLSGGTQLSARCHPGALRVMA